MIKERDRSGAVAVTFTLPSAVGAHHAAICGDWNEWSPEVDVMDQVESGFVKTVLLDGGRTYRFRYLLDGSRWENDWAADRYEPNRYGTTDSVLDLTALPWSPPEPQTAASPPPVAPGAPPSDAAPAKRPEAAQRSAPAKKSEPAKRPAPPKRPAPATSRTPRSAPGTLTSAASRPSFVGKKRPAPSPAPPAPPEVQPSPGPSAAPTSAGTSVEREAKLVAPAGLGMPNLDELVPGTRAVSRPVQRLDATYYDTPDLRLARSGITVRHRGGESGPPWTVKLPEDGSSSDFVRREIRFDGPSGRVPDLAADLVLASTRTQDLAPVARLTTVRRPVEIRDGRGQLLAEVVDDTVSVAHDEEPVGRFREVEVELHINGAKGRRVLRGGADTPRRRRLRRCDADAQARPCAGGARHPAARCRGPPSARRRHGHRPGPTLRCTFGGPDHPPRSGCATRG